MDMDPTQLLAAIGRMYEAHTHKAKKPRQALRHLDGKTPFAVHPLWCCATVLMEPDLPAETRYLLAYGLLYHDLIEDTDEPLPADVTPDVAAIVRDMTFEGGTPEEEKRIWGKPPVVRLAKLYDKTNTLLDASWMSDGGRRFWCSYVLRLADDVERNYGTLNIVLIARKLAGERTRNGFKTRTERK